MRTKNPGKATERRVLKKIGARPQPNSGSTPGMPNDGVKGKYLIEVKSTVKKSMSIKEDWLMELEENALMHGKNPALVLVFREKPWVVVPLEDFEKMSLGWRTR